MTCLAFAGKCGARGASEFSPSSIPASPNMPKPAPTVRNASRRVIVKPPDPSVHKQKFVGVQQGLSVTRPEIPWSPFQVAQPQLQFASRRRAAEQNAISALDSRSLIPLWIGIHASRKNLGPPHDEFAVQKEQLLRRTFG